MNAQTTSTQDKIAVRAYEIWEKAGCPKGKDKEHWQQAERELCAKRCAPTSQPFIAATTNGVKNRGARARVEACV